MLALSKSNAEYSAGRSHLGVQGQGFVPALSLISYVTLSKSLDLSQSQQNKDVKLDQKLQPGSYLVKLGL